MPEGTPAQHPPEPLTTPGKRTLTEALPAIQRAVVAPGQPGADDPAQVHAAASRGVATAASPLPHYDEIQRLFGRHDVSSVQAHTGSDAQASAGDMGAKAYAAGDHVVLGAGADLHTVAHEAAHTVQQRGGVQLKGGVGAEGDVYERHADEVADRVVRGQSAEALLDRHAGGGAPASGGPGAVQHKIDGYSRALPSNARVLKDTTDTQAQQLRALHADPNTTYTVEQARQQVGAPPLAGTGGSAPPFPFRYAQSGPQTMDTVQDNDTGLVQMPSQAPQDMGDDNPQISVVGGSTYGDLQQGSDRAITQTAVMDNVSPNDAARQLGLAMVGPLSWEWLHLVAFSIGETHVNQLSVQSQQLIQRTGQPQQISENLVLGTAAANTAMLSWETALKRTMQAHSDWTLQLFVAARKQSRQVQNARGATVTIPVATSIEYHFQFTTAAGQTTGPVILRFNTQSHDRPPLSEFSDAVSALERNTRPAVAGTAAQVTPHGIDTGAMDMT